MNPIEHIAIDLLDILPNPVLVKDAETRYVWVNRAFEELFSMSRADLVGRLDRDVFPNRQVAQCNGGDLRVLATGELDEAIEVVIDPRFGERHTITRKIRQTCPDGEHFLLGVMHDITEVTTVNRQLSEAATQLEVQARQLRLMATTDPLTGCLNRRALHASAQERFAAHNADCALLMMDLDHFKVINDDYGHTGGDAALKHFSDCVHSVLRESDVLARIGGEEFAALLFGADLDTAETIAERICAHVRGTPLEFEGRSITLTVSIGVTIGAVAERPTLDEMLRKADRVLYQAKASGRDRFATAAA